MFRTVISDRKVVRRLALAAGASVLALTAAACSSSSEVASFPQERNFLDGDPMGALGLRPRRQENISYNPRSPLVMPPDPNLQTPKEEAQLTAAWPQDPDELARQQEEERQEYLRERAENEDRTRAMTPAELREWSRQSGFRTPGGDQPARNEVSSVGILSPEFLRRGRRTQESNVLAEPPRRRLTQPPEGYRQGVPDENGVIAVPEEEPGRRGIFSRWRGNRSNAQTQAAQPAPAQSSGAEQADAGQSGDTTAN